MRHVEIYLNLTLGHAFLKYSEGDEVRCAWKGHLDLPEDDKQACAILWAYFQNPLGVMVESVQDQAWIERTQQVTNDYKDRSLSAGDVITIDERSYAVEFMGWREVKPLTGQPLVGPEGDDRLREQAEDYNRKQAKCPACGGPLEITEQRVSCKDTITCGFKQEGEGLRTYIENSGSLEGFDD